MAIESDILDENLYLINQTKSSRMLSLSLLFFAIIRLQRRVFDCVCVGSSPSQLYEEGLDIGLVAD